MLSFTHVTTVEASNEGGAIETAKESAEESLNEEGWDVNRVEEIKDE